MKDRVPLYPGRVKMVPVAGQENVYNMTRADQPTQEGTPLNKATLLKDATAALFGLGADSVPDDALAYLGKYAQHWWRRRSKNLVYAEVLTPISNTEYANSLGLSVYSSAVVPGTIQYASSIQFNSEGKATLNNPSNKTVSVSYGQNLGSELDDFKGKYILGCIKGHNTVTQDIFKVAENAEAYSWSGGGYTIFLFKQDYAYLVSSKQKYVYGEWEYVQSSDRHTYPDSGEQNGYEYQYLGIPFDNAASPHVKIATGSYVGTGTEGADNPNSLTFEFEPKMVFVIGGNHKALGAFSSPVLSKGMSIVSFGSGSIDGLTVSWSGSTVTWYYLGSAASQLNEINSGYEYLAIG